VLPAHRAERGVGNQVARAGARAVDHERRLAGDLGQTGERARLDLPACLREPCHEVVEVARHVDQGHLDPEGAEKAIRDLVALADLKPGEHAGRRRLRGTPRGELPASDPHPCLRAARELPQLA